MRNIRLLIVDHNEAFAHQVGEYLQNMPRIEALDVLLNGEEAAQYIYKNQPDAVLLELILDGLDGISLLKKINEMQHPPTTIVCTEFFNDASIRRARRYGASSFLCKPVLSKSLYEAIVESVEADGHALLREETLALQHPRQTASPIASALTRRGIPAQSIGFRYLVDAVSIAQENSDALDGITKVMYPEIAKLNNTTSSNVERGIRTAINYAHKHANLSIDGRKPTNRRFIQSLMIDASMQE